MEEIGEDDSIDDIEEDSNENQADGESVQEETNFRNLLQTTRDMAELAGPGGVEQEQRTFLE